MKIHFWCMAALSGAVVAGAAAARADTVNANGFNYRHAQVRQYKNGTIRVLINGNTERFAVAKVKQLTITGDGSFNRAEAAAAAAHWKRAYRAYHRAIAHSSSKRIRMVMEVRAIRAAEKSGHWAQAVRYFLRAYKKDAVAKTAALWPAHLPGAHSKALTAAITELKAALGSSHLQGPAQQKTLKYFLLQVYNQQGSRKAGTLAKNLGGHVPVMLRTTVHKKQPVNRAASRAIQGARQAMGAKNFAQVITLADGALPSAQGLQAAALYNYRAAALGAESHYRQAALSYLRVVFNFPRTPLAPNALYQAAVIIGKNLHHPKRAAVLFKQLKTLYPKSPVAAKAP